MTTLDNETIHTLMRILECDLDTKRNAIMQAIDYGHDNVIPQHIKTYRTARQAVEKFELYVRGLKDGKS